ncbi:DUF4843 domain-containing protein [Sphingobacterium hungaricum]
MYLKIAWIQAIFFFSTVKIPVRIMGISSNVDRKYSVTISSESDYDPALVELSDFVIPANEYEDTLYVTIKNDVILETKIMKLKLDLVANNDFEVGNIYNKSIEISFTDQLIKPSWWNTWQIYFGTYYKEVYQAWIQIYPEGADPTGYYWNNMPPSASWISYPVTYAFIQALEKFFIDNVIYPENDSTKPRILLP